VFENGTERMTTRWPDLADLLAAARVQAVQAHPLRWHGRILGAVNIFYAEPTAQTEERVVSGQAFADMATLILLTPQEIAASDVAARTGEALAARTVVERAKGVLAYQNRVSVDRAYELLLELAASDGLTLTAVADAVVRRASQTS
jgi:hypothetical protein